MLGIYQPVLHLSTRHLEERLSAGYMRLCVALCWQVVVRNNACNANPLLYGVQTSLKVQVEFCSFVHSNMMEAPKSFQ